ncbi:hypothetical protein QL285_070657 [Trifolium repens]|nr:hypothetical protein QL285_070657 [Trifolium repens]
MGSKFPPILRGSPKDFFVTVHIPNEFNRSNLNPLITFGWPRIRHYYQWTRVKTLSFHYYGEDTFLMIICEGRGNISRASFPTFSGLSTNRGDYRSFQMTMTESNVNSSNLILSEEFGNWIKLSEYSKIKLSGPLNNVVTCKLGRKTQNGVQMYFDKGWKRF